MIISASYRSDIPAFWADWFRNCLARGYCDVASPYGGGPYRVDLQPAAVDGFVFWTRNADPFRDALNDVSTLGRPFFVQFTLTGYSRVLDPYTPTVDSVIAQFADLADSFGRRSVVWRYDPIVLTSEMTADWHVGNFTALAARLGGLTDECIVSFAHMYRKTRRRLGQAARDHGFSVPETEIEEKRDLLRRLAPIAGDHGMALNLCAQPEIPEPMAGAARCIDAVRLSDIAGREVRARQKGNRAGCLCAESRDIGSYDSCAHGCVYCYAVSCHDRAARRVQAARGIIPG